MRLPHSSYVSTVLYLTGFTAFLGLYLPQPILPVFAQDFALNPKDSSLLISLTILGLGLASPVVGLLSDRFGHKTLLLLASALLSLILLGCALSPNFAVLLLLRFLQGLCLAALFVAALAYTTEQLGQTVMASVVGFYVSATVVGGLLGRLLGGISADYLHWRYGFVLSSLASMMLIVLWSRTPEPKGLHSSSLATALRGTLKHLQSPKLLGGLGLGFCLFFAFQSTFSYLPFRLRASPYSLSATLISFSYLSFVTGMVSSAFAGHFRQALGLRYSLLLGLGLAVLGNLVTLASSLALILLGLLIVCFGNWLVQGLAVGFIATTASTERAGANALYLFFYYLGGSAGSYLPGLGFSQFGYGGAVGLSILALLIGCFFTKQLVSKKV